MSLPATAALSPTGSPKHILDRKIKTYDRYTYLDRGSDERQYCAPGIDLPVVSLLRTKYGKFPEYHTSLDNLDLVSPEGLQGSLDLHRDCIRLLEENRKYQVTTLGEPQLGKRNLRTSLGAGQRMLDRDRMISNLIAYCDGNTDLDRSGRDLRRMRPGADPLHRRAQGLRSAENRRVNGGGRDPC